MAGDRFIYRFGRDLRLDDHAGLTAAASRGVIVPVLIVDPALEARLARSPRRTAFFCRAVGALDAELRERGSQLVIRRGPPGATIKQIAREAGAAGAAWSAAYDGAAMNADERLQSELEEAGLAAAIVHDAPAIPPDETAAARSTAGEGYRAFAPYFEVWRGLPVASHEHPLLVRFARAGLPTEGLPQAGEFGAADAGDEAGPAAARRTLERFLRNGVAHYAVAATVPSEDLTSHLSAHLSFGSISARSTVAAVRKRMEDPLLASEERLSVRLFLRALARRDFFLQLGWFHPRSDAEPLQEKMRRFPLTRSHPALEAWRAGTTGFPLIDAGIRQLHETGWMHPQVRAVAASFLCFDLGVDWQIGRAEWDRWLTEDDPAVATGNWQWIAGVGADMAQYPRIYNPERQRRRIDPDGTYVRRWVPELGHVPMASWRSSPIHSPQLRLDLSSPGGYPPPVVEHERAAREFLSRYRAFVSA
ncbi:MAG: deoxyribodipyrimidine photo-lyase [Candidatus Tumulicola sp.]